MHTKVSAPAWSAGRSDTIIVLKAALGVDGPGCMWQISSIFTEPIDIHRKISTVSPNIWRLEKIMIITGPNQILVKVKNVEPCPL
jgi:hypothetical protein